MIADRLVASGDPKCVVSAGILLSETLPPGRSRVSYDHRNGSDGTLVLALLLRSDAPVPVAVRFRGGHGGPGLDALAVGHLATAAFMQQSADRETTLDGLGQATLVARGFARGETLCGVFEIECDGALRAIVAALSPGAEPRDAVGELPSLAPDGGGRSGVFALGDAERPRAVAAGEPAVIGSSVPGRADAPQDGALYGVIRTFDVELPAGGGPEPLDVVFEPSGGPATATVVIGGVAHEVGRTVPGAAVRVAAIPAGAASPVRIATMAEFNSSYPARISIEPARDRTQDRAPLVTVPGAPSLRGLTAIANASERMSRPHTRVMEPLASRLREEPDSIVAHGFEVILELNGSYVRDRASVDAAVAELFVAADVDPGAGVAVAHGYLAARLTKGQIAALLAADETRAGASGEAVADTAEAPLLIARVWTDHETHPLLTHSLAIVKGDAAHASFAALGADVVWAVLDSGIERHPHFEKHGNLRLAGGLRHRDFTLPAPADVAYEDLADPFGHGTHVAGIIAGEWAGAALPLASRATYPDPTLGVVAPGVERMRCAPRGMAPKATLVSMRVIDANGGGKASAVIAALDEIFRINGYGGVKRIHGVNLSVGYEFFPNYEACGRTPVCEAVNRLVDSGVVVVVAAGNSGDVLAAASQSSARPVGLMASINDPGNADRAITVASCYNREPFTNGIAPSSSKGPTLDGRPKPDVTAPGEHVVSCATAATKAAHGGDYVEMSGTSMAAPHVSGALAAFLSARREFIGRPAEVRARMVRHATDLARDRAFQGAGLINLFAMLAD